MTQEAEPSSTRLINVPVIFNNRKSSLLLYTNDLQIGKKGSRALPVTELPLMAPHMDYGGVDYGDKKSQLMIVPVPNPTNETEFGLVSVSEYSVKNFRNSVHEVGKSLIDRYLIFSDAMLGRSRGMLYSNANSMTDSIAVVRVGNYDISVAPTYEDLIGRINWNHFDLPVDFEMRKATFSDKTLYPQNMAYVVAKAVNNIKDDGFGIIYRDVGQIYFPTAHEATSSFHDYDVMCYDFTDSNRNYPFKINNAYCYKDQKYAVPVSSDKTALTMTEDSSLDKIKVILRKLSTKCVTNVGNDSFFQVDYTRVKVLNVIPIKIRAMNQNIWLQKTNQSESSTKETINKETITKENIIKETITNETIKTPQEFKIDTRVISVDSIRQNDESQNVNMCNII
jgi:hypothetical protein